VTTGSDTVMHGSRPRGSDAPGVGAFLLAGLAVLAVAALVVALFVGTREPAAATLSARPGSLSTAERATIESVTRYWRQEMPRTYDRDYKELRGGYQPKTPRSKPWTCGGKRVTYKNIRGNAFYCGGPNDDYIAYDASFLFPRLNKAFGSVSPAIVLAHETGHAIQHRAGVQAPSIVIELQADCFAGSWSGFAHQSSADTVDLAPNALDSSVAVMLTLRDQVGSPATNPQAHGLGFDRVNAFQTGYDDGAKACARFPSAGVPTTELPFRTPLEAQTHGNLPYSVAVPLFEKSLDGFWATAAPRLKPGGSFRAPDTEPVRDLPLPRCAGQQPSSVPRLLEYCARDNVISWPDSRLLQVHARLGDMATGAVLSDGWGEAAQTQMGLPVEGRDAGLQRDCFTGAWVSALASGAQPELSLSPGDVDEVLGVIVASSFQPGAERSDRAGAFDRTQALRAGVLQGLSACG
jgi:predicted metalloprotease